MRSEHNGGASLAAFLLAVSTMTLLFVSPVEGQGTPCTTNADCEAGTPYCNIPEGETEGECSSNCVISAFPLEPGSCINGDICGREIDGGTGEPTGVNECVPCGDFNFDTDTPADCETVLAASPFNQEADVVANCQRECFDVYACTSNADCPTEPFPTTGAGGLSFLAFCNVPDGETEGACGACVVGAYPGESGSCAVIPAGEVGAGRQICGRDPTTAFTGCVPCVAADSVFQFEFGTDATAADCELLATDFDQPEDVVANCERECFAVYSCTTDADCPDNLPFCNAGQCAVSAPTFSPTDGMGGGSSA